VSTSSSFDHAESDVHMDLEPLDLRGYLSILWARKWTLILVVVATTAVAYAYSTRQTPVYVSSAEVLVRRATFDRFTGQFAELKMETEKQVANSPPVAKLASGRLAELGVEPGGVSASTVFDAETIVFEATASDPSAAQATADVYARAYLEYRENTVQEDLAATREPFESRIDEISSELDQISASLATVDDPTQRSVLTDRYEGLVFERSALRDRLNDLPFPEAVEVGEVLGSASLPGSPASPDPIRDATLGFIVGLALGVGGAFFRERMDQRVRGRGDLEIHSGAPVLGLIPRIRSREEKPIMLSEPRSDAAEAYNALRVRVLHASTQRGLKTLVVTSSLPGEGKTSTTANLGISMALADKRVVLVSADLRRPALKRYFRGRAGKGLTEVLQGKTKVVEALHFTGTPNLWILDTGSRNDGDGPLALLGSDAMHDLLADLAEFADLVLLDTPPLLTSSDVAALAPLTDGALFVVDARLVQRPAVEQARHELELAGTPLIGVVVNRYNPRRFRAHGTGYGYSAYGYWPASDRRPQLTLEAVRDDRKS
jgi:capsular exopolysaccharide synthesis family protein